MAHFGMDKHPNNDSTTGRFSAKSIKDRLYSKIRIRPSGCWEWTGDRNDCGYGMMNFMGKKRRAHRVSWEFHKGKIPKGLYVLHRCDKPCCINPDHLRLGTHDDNMDDMMKKGRNDHPKMTKEQVIAIRAMAAAGVGSRKIAPLFGVVDSYIRHIVSRRAWKHV